MIKIKKSSCADTRTCDWSKVSKSELRRNSEMHIADVQKGIQFFIDDFRDSAILHDHTKIENIDGFHEDFKTGFAKTDWWVMHQREERHHLKDPVYVQDDVDLVDVIEMIVDCVVAGMARSGEYRKEELLPGLLQKAFDNTIKLLLRNIEVDK